MQFGVAGMASVYGPKVLGWESVWESVAAEAAAPTQNCLVLLYLAGGNDGLNTIVPNETADYAAYERARSAIHRVQGPTAGGRVGSTPLAGRRRDAGVLERGGLQARRRRQQRPVYGLDTLYGTATAAPARTSR